MDQELNLRRVSLLAYLIAVLGLAALLLSKALIASNIPAAIVQLGAVALMIWARIVFGRRSFHAGANPTEGGLVTRGPYRVLRHPIYAAVLYFFWAGVCDHLSALNVLFALVATAGLAIRILAEERLLTGRYPEYREYAARTKRILPYIL